MAHAAVWRQEMIRTGAEVAEVLDQFLEMLAQHGYDEKDRFCLHLALQEALVNAVKHGHRGDDSKKIAVRFQVSGEEALIEIEDEGPGFDPDAVPDPSASENLERACGRGVFLMRYYMNWVKYSDRGNCVTMCRRRSRPRAAISDRR